MNLLVGAVVLLGVVGMALRQLGWLPEPRSMSYWRERAEGSEKAFTDQAIELTELKATRSFEPIIDRLDITAQLQAEAARQQAMVLERLAHHNGSFRHMEETWAEVKESLIDIHRSFETMTAFIASLQNIPVDGGRGDNLIESKREAA